MSKEVVCELLAVAGLGSLAVGVYLQFTFGWSLVVVGALLLVGGVWGALRGCNDDTESTG